MKNIPILIILLVLLSMALSSCTDRARAKRLVRQAYTKIDKAERLDPTSVDSIKGKKKVEFSFPEVTGGWDVKPEIDTTAFDSTQFKYERLKKLVADLSLTNKYNERDINDLGTYAGDIEARNALLQKANKELKTTKDRLMRGFSKDSTYVQDDSLATIYSRVRDGLLDSTWYVLKARKAEKTISTTDINLQAGQPIWRQTWFWSLVTVIVILILVIIAGKRR